MKRNIFNISVSVDTLPALGVNEWVMLKIVNLRELALVTVSTYENTYLNQAWNKLKVKYQDKEITRERRYNNDIKT